jgi:hypothetical protein
MRVLNVLNRRGCQQNASARRARRRRKNRGRSSAAGCRQHAAACECIPRAHTAHTPRAAIYRPMSVSACVGGAGCGGSSGCVIASQTGLFEAASGSAVVHLTVREGASLPTLSSLLALAPAGRLSSLRVLIVPRAQLRTLAGAASLPALEELYCAGNALTALSGLEHCARLVALDASHNDIASASELLALACCPALRALALTGNPVCGDAPRAARCADVVRRCTPDGLRLLLDDDDGEGLEPPPPPPPSRAAAREAAASEAAGGAAPAAAAATKRAPRHHHRRRRAQQQLLLQHAHHALPLSGGRGGAAAASASVSVGSEDTATRGTASPHSERAGGGAAGAGRAGADDDALSLFNARGGGSGDISGSDGGRGGLDLTADGAGATALAGSLPLALRRRAQRVAAAAAAAGAASAADAAAAAAALMAAATAGDSDSSSCLSSGSGGSGTSGGSGGSSAEEEPAPPAGKAAPPPGGRLLSLIETLDEALADEPRAPPARAAAAAAAPVPALPPPAVPRLPPPPRADAVEEALLARSEDGASPLSGRGAELDDAAIVAMLRCKPRAVPALATRAAFRRFFAGVPRARMQRLLELGVGAGAGAGADDCAAAQDRVARRMALLADVLA